MAKGIITCTGEQINIGDKVRTPAGTVVRVTGAAIGVEFHNAEQCTHVDSSEPTTAEVNAAKLGKANKGEKEPVKPVSGGQRSSDCIIWGT